MQEVVLATIVFTAIVAGIVSRIVDEVAVSLFGVVLMIVLLKEYNVHEAFEFIDWDILAILFGMWIITGYMIKAGLAEYVVSRLVEIASSYRSLLLLLAVASGFLSILVDNVIVILVFGSIAVRLAKEAGGRPILAVILVGLSANFMGTALLMGDLPPQLLHGIAGMEFIDFIVWRGAPSSFILLTITFFIVLGIYYMLFIKKEPTTAIVSDNSKNINKKLLFISSMIFIITIIGMALRPKLGVPLGFITVSGASLISLIVEIMRKTGEHDFPAFEEIVKDVEWRALLFYATLFSLVGGLEASGALKIAAEHMLDHLASGVYLGYTIGYWIVAALSTFVEHDALLITFLYLAKDAAPSLPYDPGILYWGMAWSATLASNLTTAAAPALYVAVTIAEKEAGHKVSGLEFIRYSGPFVIASLLVHYVITVLLWLPLVSR